MKNVRKVYKLVVEDRKTREFIMNLTDYVPLVEIDEETSKFSDEEELLEQIRYDKYKYLQDNEDFEQMHYDHFTKDHYGEHKQELPKVIDVSKYKLRIVYKHEKETSKSLKVIFNQHRGVVAAAKSENKFKKYLNFLKDNMFDSNFLDYLASTYAISTIDTDNHISLYKKILLVKDKQAANRADLYETRSIEEEFENDIKDINFRISKGSYREKRDLFLGISEYRKRKVMNKFDIEKLDGNYQLIVRENASKEVALKIPSTKGSTYLFLIDQITKKFANDTDFLKYLISVDILNLEVDDYSLTIQSLKGKKVEFMKEHTDIQDENKEVFQENDTVDKNCVLYQEIKTKFYELITKDLFEEENIKFVEYLKRKGYLDSDKTYELLKKLQEMEVKFPEYAKEEFKTSDLDPFLFNNYESLRNILIAMKRYNPDFLKSFENFEPFKNRI